VRRAATAPWRLGFGAALLAWTSMGAAEAAAPPCQARARLEPSQARVGQQVLYRLRVLSSREVEAVEWIEPPPFAALRVERLPGRPQLGEETHDGIDYRVREEHRALFPERAGWARVGAARLRCRTARGSFETTAPALALRVQEPPQANRPADFSGLTGPIAVTRRIEPPTVALGASLRLTVRLQGGGNLWDAPEPYPDDDAFGGAEVFRSRPELDLERGTSLVVRRRFVYELVPRKVGVLQVPELRIPYFDPAAGRYGTAGAPALQVNVAPAALGASPRQQRLGPRDVPGPVQVGERRTGGIDPRHVVGAEGGDVEDLEEIPEPETARRQALPCGG
jgi:hypothetical protein